MQPPPPFNKWPEAEPLYYEPSPQQWQQHPQHRWNPPHAPYQQPQPFSTACGGYNQLDRYPHLQGSRYPHVHRDHYGEEQHWGSHQQECWYPPDPFHENSQHGNQNPQHGGTNASTFESGRATEDLSGPHWVPFDDSDQDTSFNFQSQQNIPKVIPTAHIPPSTRDLQHPDSTEHRTAPEGGMSKEDYKGSFLAKVQQFVVKNSEAFNVLAKGATRPELVPTLHNTHSEESCKLSNWISQCSWESRP